MDIIQITTIGLLSAVLVIMLKHEKPEIAMLVSLAAGGIIFLLISGKLLSIIRLLNDLVNRVQLDTIYFGTVLKIIGITYIAEFGSQICKDAGENSIASKIELAGKILVLVLALPIVVAIFDLINKIMP